MAGIFGELEAQARADFAAQGLDAEPSSGRLAAMRYQGQNYEQEVPFPEAKLDDEALRAAYERYGKFYEDFYGYRLDGIPIELVRLSVIATGETPSFPRLPGVPEPSDTKAQEREVFFPGAGFVATSDPAARRRLRPATSSPAPRSSNSWTRPSSCRRSGRCGRATTASWK